MQNAVILFRTLLKDISVEVFANFDVDDQVEIINIITDPEITSSMRWISTTR